MTVTDSRPTRSEVVVPPRGWLAALPAVRFGIVNAALAVITAVAVLGHAAVLPTDVVLVVAVGVGCAPLALWCSAGAGLLAWAWATGFAENSYGELTFSSADLTRLGWSAAGAILVAVLTRGVRAAVAAHWSRGPSIR